MNCLLLPKSAFEQQPHLPYQRAIISNPQQLKHIKEVLHSQVGDVLKIAEQQGNLGYGKIKEISDSHIILADVQLRELPPPKLDLMVILALPRPKVLRRLIIDMTALGVKKIILINSYRSQKSYWQSPMLDRLDEFVQEGLQQACDSVAPTILLKKRFKPFVEDELTLMIGDASAIVAHPYAPTPLSRYLQENHQLKVADDIHGTHDVLDGPLSPPFTLPKVLCVGAEGGWIDYEVELLKSSGCQPVSLGERILRTEAAINALIGQWLIHQPN